MAPVLDERAAVDLVGRAEELLQRVERLSDPVARTAAVELVQALLELYGEGLRRVTAAVVHAGGDALAAELADDDLVAHLLLLHDLHPLELPARVARAVRIAAARLGGALAGPATVDGVTATVDGPTVRLRLPAEAAGCRSTAAAVHTAFEDAIRAAAPEIERVEIEQAPPLPTLIPLASLRRNPAGRS